jgi:hypothetical protein
MKNRQRPNYLILLVLALVFACPGLAAYVFYNHPQWLGATAINKGLLLNPPEQLTYIHAKPKWRLMLWYPGTCDLNCLQQLDKLGRIRLALGRRLYEVDEWLINAKQDRNLSESLHQSLSEKDIQVLVLSKEQQAKQNALGDQAQIFIANPDNYLVLAYSLTAPPEDIFHDLQKLLSSSENKRG